MSLATRVKGVAATTVTLIILGYVGLWVMEGFHPDPGPRGVQPKAKSTSSDDHYVLSSKWFPSAPTHAVSITVTVDGWPMVQKKQRVSPFGQTLVTAKGTVVVFQVTSHLQSMQSIDCMILKNNRMVERTGFDSINGAGTVKCTA